MIANPRAQIILRKAVGQIERDRRGLEYDHAIVVDGRNLAMRMRVARIRRACAIAIARLDPLDRIRCAELLQKKNHAARARPGMVIEDNHGNARCD